MTSSISSGRNRRNGDADDRVGRFEEQEQAAPVGDGGELTAQQQPDDGDEPAERLGLLASLAAEDALRADHHPR